jgi:hypothetical protein
MSLLIEEYNLPDLRLPPQVLEVQSQKDDPPQGLTLTEPPSPTKQHLTALGSLGQPPEMYEPL